MLLCMPVRLRRSLGPTLNEKLVRSYAEEAARLRDLAVNVTTVRLRTRLLEEAENHDRLALAARRGIRIRRVPDAQSMG